jgi:hypothetical protein
MCSPSPPPPNFKFIKQKSTNSSVIKNFILLIFEKVNLQDYRKFDVTKIPGFWIT